MNKKAWILLAVLCVCPLTAAANDFDGDARADMPVWRPGNGTWYWRTSGTNWNGSLSQQWGTQGDVPLMSTDFDGDGRADVAVWRPSNGTWYVRTSSSGYSSTFNRQWGAQGDLPLMNTDFDGDSKADIAVWRPSSGTWYVRTSTSDWNSTFSRQWGTQGDQPLMNTDFDGDGKADMAVWRPSNGVWYVRTSSTNWNSSFSRQWGTVGDRPLDNTDFDGDGKADMGVWRPSNGTWYVRTSTTNWNSWFIRQWGTTNDVPLRNTDFDGDGKADVAVWRPSNGIWYVRTSASNWNSTFSRQWGTQGDVPLESSDFDGDSKADMTVWRPGNGVWYVRTSASNWSSSFSRQWGASTDTPLRGDWLRRPRVELVNLIPRSLSGETNQDSEPFLAVHPNNRLRMAASAFTPNPAGLTSPTAPIFVSSNGGHTWTLNNIVPSQAMTGDITHAFNGIGSLHGGILRRPGFLLLNELVALDFLAPTVMTVQLSRNQIDQPWVQAIQIGGMERVYVGNNDFAATSGRTATVEVSNNGGTSFTSARIEARNTSGQNGPSIRSTAALDGTVYAAYFGWRSFSGGIATSDVVVVRDDAGGFGATPFQSLLGTDGQAGQLVASGVQIPWSNAPTLGQERIGSTLSIAAHPGNSSIVYVAWADRTGSDIYTVHVRRSTDRGVTWSQDLRTISNATNMALAVSGDGTLGLLYQRVEGTGASSRWVTHLEQTRDGFASMRDMVLATVPANSPAPAFLPYIGDYSYLVAVGRQFRGVFSANNTPDLANFPFGVKYQRAANFATRNLDNGSGSAVAVSIDPFYFCAPRIP